MKMQCGDKYRERDRKRQMGEENASEERQKLHPFDPLTWLNGLRWYTHHTIKSICPENIHTRANTHHPSTQRLSIPERRRDLNSLSMWATHMNGTEPIQAEPNRIERRVPHSFDFSQIDVTQVTFAIRFFVLSLFLTSIHGAYGHTELARCLLRWK